jgi:hypothetical protein
VQTGSGGSSPDLGGFRIVRLYGSGLGRARVEHADSGNWTYEQMLALDEHHPGPKKSVPERRLVRIVLCCVVLCCVGVGVGAGVGVGVVLCWCWCWCCVVLCLSFLTETSPSRKSFSGQVGCFLLVSKPSHSSPKVKNGADAVVCVFCQDELKVLLLFFVGLYNFLIAV